MTRNPKSILPDKLPRNPNLLQEAVRRRDFLAKEVTAAAEPLTVYLKGARNKKRSLTIVLRVSAIRLMHLDCGRIRAITHISQGGGIVTAQTQEKGDEIPRRITMLQNPSRLYW